MEEQQNMQFMKEQNAQSEAITAMIKVEATKKGEDSQIELKTELTEDEIRGHTMLAIASKYIEMTPQQFGTKCILGDLIDKKERKALSHNRESRKEIVQITRQPDMNMDMQKDVRKEGILRRLFSVNKT